MNRLLHTSKRILPAVLAVAIGLALTGAARANAEVYQKVVRSTVWILAPGDEGMSMGSGVLIDVEKRLVLTNYHVVGKRESVNVYFAQFDHDQLVVEPAKYKKVGIKGKVLEAQSKRDLALVQLEKVPEGVQAVPLAAKLPAPGESIHAIGNSGASEGALWRYIPAKVRAVYFKKYSTGSHGVDQFRVQAWVIENDGATNGGDSGGPVVNDKGELVAITQSYQNDQRAVSFSIAVTEVRLLLADLGKPKAKDDERRAERRPLERDEDRRRDDGNGSDNRGSGRPEEEDKE